MTTDPITIAREVLDLAQEDETVTVCSVPDNKVAALARAVGRVADLADELEAWANKGQSHDAYAFAVAAFHIRNALNGDNA